MTPLRRSISLLTLLTALILSYGAAPASGQGALANRLFLPALHNGPRSSVIGLEMKAVIPSRGLDLVVASDTRWVRRNGLFWKDVEPEPGKGYRWDAPSVRGLEQEMRNASANNIDLILIVRASPRWATAPYQSDCAPVSPDRYDEFAAFMAAAVERYSRPPFNVKYWEIGNEPDAYIFQQDHVFGCWGVEGDPYYGGEAYGRALRAVSAAMKRANPAVKVLNGGLLLFRPYDPNDPRSRSGRFFEGMLRAGAGGSFDIVSFHSYDYYYNGQTSLGPREDWRVGYLRGLLDRYGVPQKPLLRTESALLCPVLTAECRWAQADYMARLYARSMRDGLLGNIWYIYDNDSFHSAALIDPGATFVPRPSYFAYRATSELLGDSRYVGPLRGVPAEVEGYEFSQHGRTVVVFWSEQTRGVEIALPAGHRDLACYDRDGAPLDCRPAGGKLFFYAHRSPIFVTYR